MVEPFKTQFIPILCAACDALIPRTFFIYGIVIPATSSLCSQHILHWSAWKVYPCRIAILTSVKDAGCASLRDDASLSLRRCPLVSTQGQGFHNSKGGPNITNGLDSNDLLCGGNTNDTLDGETGAASMIPDCVANGKHMPNAE
jgi:hypothetical protein